MRTIPPVISHDPLPISKLEPVFRPQIPEAGPCSTIKSTYNNDSLCFPEWTSDTFTWVAVH